MTDRCGSGKGPAGERRGIPRDIQDQQARGRRDEQENARGKEAADDRRDATGAGKSRPANEAGVNEREALDEPPD